MISLFSILIFVVIVAVLSYQKLATDIEYFAKKVAGKTLVGRQPTFAKSCMKNRHTIACFSRQSGKSTTISICVVHRLLFGKNVKMGIYGPTKETAMDVMYEYVCDLFRSHPALLNQVVGGEKGLRASGRIKMRNGNKLRVFTASKDAKSVRGYDPTVIVIDESQGINDTKYRDEIRPSGSAIQEDKDGNEIRVQIWEAGTPLGRNHYYDTCINAVSYEETDGLQAVIVYQPYTEYPRANLVEIMAQREESTSLRRWEQEYLCKWNLDTGYAFDWDDVKGACHIERPSEWEHEERGSEKLYCAGIDLGRNRDHSVMVVFEYSRPVYKMVFLHQWDLHLTWQMITAEIEYFMDYWKPHVTIVDRGNAGDVIYENMVRKLSYNVEPWAYTGESKANLMVNVQRIMERGNLSMYKDEVLLEQFKIIEEGRSNITGKPVYNKPEKTHDDMVQAVAMALMGGRTEFGDDGTYSLGISAAPVSEFMKSVGIGKEAIKQSDMFAPLPGFKKPRKSIWEKAESFGLGDLDSHRFNL